MEKVRVTWPVGEDGTIPSEAEMVRLATEAGWSDSPLDGKAILYNGGEILNPVPVAPPIGYVPRDPLEDRLRAMVQSAVLAGKEELEETAADVLDFDIPDELPDLTTIYEFAGMQDEAPAPPAKELTPAEKAAMEVEYEELKALERKRRTRQEAARRALLVDVPDEPIPDTSGVRSDPVG